MIGHDGTPRIHEQLYVLPVDDDGSSAEDDGEEGDAGDDTGEAADADRKPVVAYSQRLTHELAEMKAEMLRVHVASDPRFALDLMTFWMADKATRNYGVYDLATELRADAASSPLAGYESNTPAGEQWEKLGEALDRSWVDVGDCAERFDAFRALDDGARAAWLGWLVARTIVAVPAGSSGEALIDHLGTKLEIDVALWWRPTATNYFDRISKGAILAHLQTQGPAETPHKRLFTYRMAQFRAEQDGIAYRMPPVHPFHPIRVLRLAIALGATHDVVRTIYRFIWAEGRDVTDPQGWQDLSERLGLRADEAVALTEAPAVKAALRENTDAAMAAGVFGVPTFAFDGVLYWGDDATALFRHCLAHPAWLHSPDVERLQHITIGVRREG